MSPAVDLRGCCAEAAELVASYITPVRSYRVLVERPGELKELCISFSSRLPGPDSSVLAEPSFND